MKPNKRAQRINQLLDLIQTLKLPEISWLLIGHLPNHRIVITTYFYNQWSSSYHYTHSSHKDLTRWLPCSPVFCHFRQFNSHISNPFVQDLHTHRFIVTHPYILHLIFYILLRSFLLPHNQTFLPPTQFTNSPSPFPFPSPSSPTNHFIIPPHNRYPTQYHCIHPPTSSKRPEAEHNDTMHTTCARRPPMRNVPLSISGLIAGAAAAAAGVILGQISSATVTPPQQSCETCGGEGYVDCLCARWNYAAATSDRPPPTCDTCKGSRRQRCPRCRGGGTKIPLLKHVPIPVRIREPLEDIFNRSVLLPLFAMPLFRLAPKTGVGRLVAVDQDEHRTGESAMQLVRL